MTSYRKTQRNFLANPVFSKTRKEKTWQTCCKGRTLKMKTATRAQYSKSAGTPEPGQCGWMGSTLGWAPAGSPLWRQQVKSQELPWWLGEAVTVPSEAQIQVYKAGS